MFGGIEAFENSGHPVMIVIDEPEGRFMDFQLFKESLDTGEFLIRGGSIIAEPCPDLIFPGITGTP